MITHQATIGSITAKVDRSLAYRVNTPELSPAEKASFMDLQNQVVEIVLKPLDDPDAPNLTIETKKAERTPSDRLRRAIYKLWMVKKEAGEYINPDFQAYYNSIMEGYIQLVKNKIEEAS